MKDILNYQLRDQLYQNVFETLGFIKVEEKYFDKKILEIFMLRFRHVINPETGRIIEFHMIK
jgi:hypothetical protein